MTLFEFATPKGVIPWTPLNDMVMGGVSEGRLEFLPGGGARFWGEVSLANGGGFAQVKYSKTRFDLSRFRVVALSVKGDGRTYQLRFQTSVPDIAYRQIFSTTANWQDVTLELGHFEPVYRGRLIRGAPPLDRSDICSVALMIAGEQAGAFELCVRRIWAA